MIAQQRPAKQSWVAKGLVVGLGALARLLWRLACHLAPRLRAWIADRIGDGGIIVVSDGRETHTVSRRRFFSSSPLGDNPTGHDRSTRARAYVADRYLLRYTWHAVHGVEITLRRWLKRRRPRVTARCEVCNAPIDGRYGRRYCSPAHRVAAHRARRRADA